MRANRGSILKSREPCCRECPPRSGYPQGSRRPVPCAKDLVSGQDLRLPPACRRCRESEHPRRSPLGATRHLPPRNPRRGSRPYGARVRMPRAGIIFSGLVGWHECPAGCPRHSRRVAGSPDALPPSHGDSVPIPPRSAPAMAKRYRCVSGCRWIGCYHRNATPAFAFQNEIPASSSRVKSVPSPMSFRSKLLPGSFVLVL